MTRHIKSFSEFISLIRKKFSCVHWIFRGENNASYKLIPTLGRLELSDEDNYEWELRMMRKMFSHEKDQGTDESSDINRLLLAQHHGAPTRLLDWTSSVLVAAYFASQKPQSDDDDFVIHAVHVCPQSTVFTHFNAHDFRNVDFYNNYINFDAYYEQRRPNMVNLHNYLEEFGVVFIIGSNISPRVGAQQGLVSIQKDLLIPLDKHEARNITKRERIVISHKIRREFQDALYQLGIRKRSLFPDHDGAFTSYKFEEELQKRLSENCS